MSKEKGKKKEKKRLAVDTTMSFYHKVSEAADREQMSIASFVRGAVAREVQRSEARQRSVLDGTY